VSHEVRVQVPDELVEEIARRGAELVRAELSASEWLTLAEAADPYRTTAGASGGARSRADYAVR
jgi:hypothetical protein